MMNHEQQKRLAAIFLAIAEDHIRMADELANLSEQSPAAAPATGQGKTRKVARATLPRIPTRGRKKELYDILTSNRQAVPTIAGRLRISPDYVRTLIQDLRRDGIPVQTKRVVGQSQVLANPRGYTHIYWIDSDQKTG
jgi:biotin operon repressor